MFIKKNRILLKKIESRVKNQMMFIKQIMFVKYYKKIRVLDLCWR
jgi:hypothetical protein